MPYINGPPKIEIAKLHLDRFWQEIFWRRENEQKVTVWSVGLFAATLALVYGAETPLTCGQRLVLSLLPLILGFFASWYLFQNWRKDKEIAFLIVRLNEALGAWEPGYLAPGEPLYPEKWRTWGIDPSQPRGSFRHRFFRDRVSLLYFCLVIVATLLCCAGIWLK